MKMTVAACLASALTLAAMTAPGIGHAQDAQAVKIYMAADGNDANAGSAQSQPVRTLERVRKLAAQAVTQRAKSVDVLIAPGTYAGQSVIWDVAGGEIPIRLSGSADQRKPTIFDGATASGDFMVVRIPKTSNEPIRTNIEVRDLTVRNYCEGISFGDFKTKQLIRDARVERVTFENIGTKYESQNTEKRGNCVAAIRVQRASDVVMKGLNFTNIENLPREETESGHYGPWALHAIYIADFSDNITISDSTFRRFTGSPIRFRNRSNGIQVINSSFAEAIEIPVARGKPAPRLAAVSQWNCTTGNKACLDKQDECPSKNIVLQGIKVDASVDRYKDENATGRSQFTCSDPEVNQKIRSRSPEYNVQIR